MKKIADLNIAKKLTLVLGGCVLLLAGASGVSWWGNRLVDAQQDEERGGLVKQLLAVKVARGTMAASIQVGRILSAEGSSSVERAELAHIRAIYLPCLD